MLITVPCISAWPAPVKEDGVSMFPAVSSVPASPASCWTAPGGSARTRTSVSWRTEAAVSSVSTCRDTGSASESQPTPVTSVLISLSASQTETQVITETSPLNLVNTCLTAPRYVYGLFSSLLAGSDQLIGLLAWIPQLAVGSNTNIQIEQIMKS